MHFYYFLYIFTSYFADFSVFLRLPCRLLYLVVTPSGVEPSHAIRGEWCTAAILTDRQQPKNKNTWIMILFPPMVSNHRKAMPGAGNHFVK